MYYVIDPQNKQVIAHAKMDNDNLFKFHEFVSSQYSLHTSIDFNIWHERLGHLNLDYITLIQKRNMVDGLPHIIPSKIACTGCMSGTMHREPFPSGKS